MPISALREEVEEVLLVDLSRQQLPSSAETTVLVLVASILGRLHHFLTQRVFSLFPFEVFLSLREIAHDLLFSPRE